MIRFLTIPEEDILADPASAGDMLLHAVRRGGPEGMIFRSLVPLGDTLLICLEPRKESDPPAPEAFHFSLFRSRTAEGAAAEIRARDQADQTLLASFFIDSMLWGLYADHRPGKKMVAPHRPRR